MQNAQVMFMMLIMYRLHWATRASFLSSLEGLETIDRHIGYLLFLQNVVNVVTLHSQTKYICTVP